MKRSIEKAISDYDKRVERSGRDPLYYSDLEQVLNISKKLDRLDPARVAINAMKAGYEIGFRIAEREARTRA